MDTLINTPSLDQIAENIRSISKTMHQGNLKGAILLGEQFLLARGTFSVGPNGKMPGWDNWVKENTPDWGIQWARTFIRIYKRSCENPELWAPRAQGLELPLTTLRALASPTLPETKRVALFHKAREQGLSRDDVVEELKCIRSGEEPKSVTKRSKRGRERFKNAVKMVCGLCETVYEMEIPSLDKAELATTISELEDAKGHLGRVLSQLKGDLK